MHYDLFSPAMIALQAELATGHHPELVQVLAQCESMPERMSALATYAQIAVDDDFDQDKLDDLCDEVREFLINNRKPLASSVTILH